MSFKLHVEQTVFYTGGDITSSQLIVEFDTEEEADIAFNAINNSFDERPYNINTFKTAIRLY